MKIHELKIWPEEFDAVVSGKKTAEFRLNDREFVVGDVLRLNRWCPHCRQMVNPPATIVVTITHIVNGPAWGIPEGYAMLSFRFTACSGWG